MLTRLPSKASPSQAALRFYAIRGLLCLAILLASCIVCGQSWSQRWDIHSTYDEQATACATDHHGNVFVAGWSKEFRSPYTDAVLIMYDSAGNEKWVRHFHSSDSSGVAYAGSSVGSGVAVDWEGNAYLCGECYSGASRHQDFFVVKFDAGGTPVWPASGSHTGYDFDNGAIRLSDAKNDGDDPLTGDKICSISLVDEDSAQPAFAIAGPTKSVGMSGGPTQWRVVRFELDGTNSVKVSSGWPVDESGNLDGASVPYGVAIYGGDGSVYAVGVQNTGIESESFRTIHYTSGGSHVWVDSWTAGDHKNCIGKAITLDRDGAAYVTGQINIQAGSNVGSAYGTRKILASASDNDPTWSKTYQYATNGYDVGRAIDLSYEVDANGDLKPYAFVTGESQHAENSDYDVATLRYRGSDGNDEWSGAKRIDRGYGDDSGRHVVAVGNGDAYVVGVSTNSSSNLDYEILGYRSDGTTRFTATTYDNGATDAATWASMGAAGLLVTTGASHHATHGDDFYSTELVEGVTGTAPSGYTLDDATYVAGALTDLTSSNNAYLEVQPGHVSSNSSSLQIEFAATISTSNPSEISIKIESHVDTAHIWQKVEVYDQLASAWVLVSDHPMANGTDQVTELTLKDDPARFIDGSGNVKVRATYYGGALTTGWTLAGDGAWNAYFDQVQWSTTGS